MPCTYYTDEEYRRMDADLIDKLTRLLCTAMQILAPVAHQIPPTDIARQELFDWWSDHKQRDAERKATAEKYEAAAIQARLKKAAAMSKLTDEERRLLNLKDYE